MSSNQQWLERRQKAVAKGVASVHPILAEKADNAEIWDIEGYRFIDFAGGIAVLNTGHRHPAVMAAVQQQSECLTHSAFQVMSYASYIELAERLNQLAPIDDAKSLLMTTGAEAVENAVKIARAHTQRPAVIAFSGAFHGRSLLTMALTGKIQPYKAGFGPMPGEIYHIPFPIAHLGISVQDSINTLQHLFKVDVEASRVAAIIIEPVQGEGGFYIAPQALMSALRELCNQHGICLIVDEVQSGFARTAKVLCIEHYDIEPDLITVAKGIAGGFPLSGVIGKTPIMDAVNPGGLGGTYGGNPVACAAALAVLDIIEKEQLCQRSEQIGLMMKEKITSWKESDDCLPLGDIRGLGAMVAFDMVDDNGQPSPQNTAALVAKVREKGLILLSCGFYGNTIRLLVPLTASDEIIKEGMLMIETGLKEL